MKKRFCSILLISLLLLSLTACGKTKAQKEPAKEELVSAKTEAGLEMIQEEDSEKEDVAVVSSEIESEEQEELPSTVSTEDKEFERVLKENELYLTLVNKTTKLPDEWDDMVTIDTTKNSLGEEIKIEHRTLEAFNELRDELMEKEGIQIELDSVYRSVAEQQEIWDYWVNDPDKGIGYCEKYLSPPGFSEHHTGLAVDIFIMKDGKEIRENDDMIADTEDFKIIHQYLASHGFILRYMEGKESITGYAYEPWHFRFVGDPKIAEEITKKGITLEQFLKEK